MEPQRGQCREFQPFTGKAYRFDGAPASKPEADTVLVEDSQGNDNEAREAGAHLVLIQAIEKHNEIIRDLGPWITLIPESAYT
eukprot:7416642-Pyramimonas_sp.AAC.1